MCSSEVHFNYQLDSSQARRRLLSYKRPLNSKPSDDPNSSISDSNIYLLGLLSGEFVLINKSINLKVIHGCAEISGHLYCVMDSYRKFTVTPWSPSERLLSLCYKLKQKSNKRLHSNSDNFDFCNECNSILNNLYGASCCQFVSTHRAHRKLVMKKFGLDETELTLESSKYAEYVKYYQSQMKQEFDTIFMFADYTSCFGTVSVYDSLDAINAPKIMSNEILNICGKMLNLFLSGSNPSLMLHGDKASGKSTVVVYIINYLLNFVSDVWLMDVDIGQPILSAPGLITLTSLSKSITSSNHSLVVDVKPKLSLLTGYIKVVNSFLFLRHFRACLDTYDRFQKGLKAPLIINTFGWTTGLGGKLIEALGSMAKVEIILKLVNLPKIHQTININTHDELRAHLKKTELHEVKQKYERYEYEIDTFPMFNQMVEELGGKVPWDKSNKEYFISSFQNYINLLRHSNLDKMCKNNEFYRLTFKREREFVSSYDMRWLRFCTYFNNSFADALHFPQLRHEEFFGSIETYNFIHNIKHVDRFETPKQIQLSATAYTIVTQFDTLPKTHSELVPMVNGCVVALCRGRTTEPFRPRLSEKWDFVSYAYLHYLNPDDLTMLISYPRYQSLRDIKNTNIIVLCMTYAFDPCPGKMCTFNTYPSTNTPKLEYLGSQMYPFRRNELLHMVGSFGAGTSAPTQRSNLKRFKNENSNLA